MSRQSTSPIFRISVTSSLTARSEAILAQLPSLGIQERLDLKIIDLYFVEGSLHPDSLHKISQTLLSDPVTDQYNWQPLGKDRVTAVNNKSEGSCQTIEVLLRPGVTDNVANELIRAAQRLSFDELKYVATGTSYQFCTDVENAAGSLLPLTL